MAKVKEKFMHEGKIKDIKAEFSALSLAVGAIGGLITYHFILRPLVPSLPALGTTENKLKQENVALRKTTNELLHKLSTMQPKPEVTPKPAPVVDKSPRKTINTFGMIGGVKSYRPDMPSPTKIPTYPEYPDLPNAQAIERQKKYGAMNKV